MILGQNMHYSTTMFNLPSCTYFLLRDNDVKKYKEIDPIFLYSYIPKSDSRINRIFVYYRR